MPLTDRSQAQESGFAQVKAALQKFKGTVTKAEFGKWGGKLVDDEGKPLPPKEFLEINTTDIEVLEVTEELSMAVDEWNFRVNCSDYKGSFWVERFLESADKFKLLVPDDLVGKRITWEKVTLEATGKDGVPKPQFNSTNYVIVAMEGAVAAAKPKVIAKVAPVARVAVPAATPDPFTAPVVAQEAPVQPDPMNEALKLAIGKTEAQFRTAVTLNPLFMNSPLLALAKSGAITLSLVHDGKLVVVKQGTKDVYALPS